MRKLDGNASSPWRLANGPGTGLLATLARIGWKLKRATDHSYSALRDDNDVQWSFLHHAPATIIEAVCESVRRWRVRRLAASLPNLVPSEPDM